VVWFLCWQGFNSPYYNETHAKYRSDVRAFVDEHIAPFTFEWDEAKELPRDLFKKTADAGWLGACCGAPWPTKYAGTKLVGGLKPEEFDVFHEVSTEMWLSGRCVRWTSISLCDVS
jgi:alkylation response protein AidB-like acyl-CoA dehydrogenase